MKPEEKVKAEHKAFLTSIGAWWFMPVQTGYGAAGVPDFLCCVQGRMVAIETKAPGKRPTKWQEQMIARINSAGGCAFWTDSLDYTKQMLKAGGVV